MGAAMILLLAASCGGGGGGGGGNGSPVPQPPPAKYTYAGRVVDAAGAGIADAQVQLSQLSRVTDESGAFSFGSLTGGTYNLSVQAPDGLFLAQQLSISADETSANIALTESRDCFEIVRIAPQLNSDGASLSGEVVLEFSREVEAASADGSDFTFTPGAGDVAVVVDGRTVTLQPALELATSQRYRLKVSQHLQSVQGQELPSDAYTYFATEARDSVPPRLVSSIPSESATDVPRNTEVRFTMSDELAPISAQDELSVTVVPSASATPAIAGNVLTLSFASALAATTEYIITVSGLKDDAENVGEQFILSFVTGSVIESFDDVEPDWNRFGDLIVFARKSGGQYDLYTMHSDGGELAQVTDTSYDERHPRFSSDGQLIAYQANAFGNWDIFVYERSSGQSVQLTAEADDDIQPTFCGTFSDIIAFVQRPGYNQPDRIFLMNYDGSLLREADVTFNRNQREPRFHPLIDNQLLFVTDEGGDSDIYVKSAFLEGDSPTNANVTGNLASNETLGAWSPDGSIIAFLSDSGGVRNVWLCDPTGAAYQRLTSFSEPVDWLVFSPNVGENLLLVSMGASGHHHLALVSLTDGTVVEELT